MKKKVVSWIVLSTVAAGMLVGVVSADFSKLSPKKRMEIQTIIQKAKNGEALTPQEQEQLEKIKADFEGRTGIFEWIKWKRGFMKWLTQEEKESLAEMSEEERLAFFQERRALRLAEKEDKKVIRQWHQAIIDKLINGEELSEEEKEILEEMKQLRAERKSKKKSK